ncbi:hypothetical protein VM1G_09149 [Cytospora mali]|uniref:Peptidase A1 domain-containing protein n=1 Tax=Cytospora mali TaxID=578113 RepID=A0A194W9W3_CYTMA|nr:hypothetical protein VM1G_09149 [Valsa mali]
MRQSSLLLGLAWSLLPGLSAAVPHFTRSGVSIGAAAKENVISISKYTNRSVKSLASPVRTRIAASKNGTALGTVNTIFSDVYPVANLTWGNAPGISSPAQQFISFLDTGSSDTWVVTQALECVEISTQIPLNQSACQFGPLYNLTQGEWTNITGLEFEIEYFPELEILNGDMAYASVSLAGITVEQQEVALVDYAAWSGDGHSSGLVGLAYPAITSATNRTTGNQIEYSPLFTNMNYSVLAPAGVIAVGGLVPEEYWEGNFTSVDIELTENIGNVTQLTWYTTTHEFVFRDANNGTLRSAGTYQSIIDCGTAPNFVPTSAAYEVNAQFDPPATYNASLGYWTVDCNARAPYAAYVIGGVEMPMRPENMIVRSLNGLQGYEDVCFSAFADGGVPAIDGPMIIGEVWQLGYVIAFDQGNKMIHFAERSGYSQYY